MYMIIQNTTCITHFNIDFTLKIEP